MRAHTVRVSTGPAGAHEPTRAARGGWVSIQRATCPWDWFEMSHSGAMTDAREDAQGRPLPAQTPRAHTLRPRAAPGLGNACGGSSVPSCHMQICVTSTAIKRQSQPLAAPQPPRPEPANTLTGNALIPTPSEGAQQTAVF